MNKLLTPTGILIIVIGIVDVRAFLVGAYDTGCGWIVTLFLFAIGTIVFITGLTYDW